MDLRYSIYERGTDRPIVIWGTAQKCADALGVSLPSFRTYVSRAKLGRPSKKYEIIAHTEKEEDVLL